MKITERIEVEDKILASGGFSDVRRGRYMGHLVAVKTLRDSVFHDSTMKVIISESFFATWNAIPTILF